MRQSIELQLSRPLDETSRTAKEISGNVGVHGLAYYSREVKFALLLRGYELAETHARHPSPHTEPQIAHAEDLTQSLLSVIAMPALRAHTHQLWEIALREVGMGGISEVQFLTLDDAIRRVEMGEQYRPLHVIAQEDRGLTLSHDPATELTYVPLGYTRRTRPAPEEQIRP